jgi:thymidylate synthase (FAD)
MPREVDTTHALVRPSAPGLDSVLGHSFPVLDHGFIRCIDFLGNDESIVQAARVSYGTGTKKGSSDEGLINYLMRHWHSTPFEMCEIKLHVKLPIFVGRQWIRHRTASVNEYSARYSIMEREFYIPPREQLQYQSTSNKQGREGTLPDMHAESVEDRIQTVSNFCFQEYEVFIDDTEDGDNLARETARMILPMNTYTQWYWKTNLHNLFNFIRLRDDPHAQWEIRQYASTIAMLVERWVPLAYEAFLRYRKNAITFSEREVDALSGFLNSEAGAFWLGELHLQNDSKLEEFSKGEWREFLAKLDRIKNDSAA